MRSVGGRQICNYLGLTKLEPLTESAWLIKLALTGNDKLQQMNSSSIAALFICCSLSLEVTTNEQQRYSKPFILWHTGMFWCHTTSLHLVAFGLSSCLFQHTAVSHNENDIFVISEVCSVPSIHMEVQLHASASLMVNLFDSTTKPRHTVIASRY